MDYYSANIMMDGKPIQLALEDMFDGGGCCEPGSDGFYYFDSLRHMKYNNKNIILICFSVDSRASMDDIRVKWVPEVKQHCVSSVPFIIVGCKTDLRHDPETLDRIGECITFEEGKAFAAELGAYKYMECSALTQAGLMQVFDEAVRAATNPTYSFENFPVIDYGFGTKEIIKYRNYWNRF